jgi:hypothetical protein
MTFFVHEWSRLQWLHHVLVVGKQLYNLKFAVRLLPSLSIAHNISLDLGTELQVRRIFANLRASLPSNEITPHHPLPPISLRIPLARRSLQPLQQIRHQLGTCTIVCPDCNTLHWIKEKSTKSKRNRPKFSTCCMNGDISLPQLPSAPVLMEELLKDQSNGIAVTFRSSSI